MPKSALPAALPALVIMAAVLFAYGASLHNGFIWDDPEYVINNPTLRTLDGLGRIWFEPGATPQYYPLVFTGFWIEYHLWGLDTFGYHLVNVLLHGLNAVLLFLLCRRLAVPGAWVVAALFALHPVQVESVAWITERKNVLSLFFYLSAFWVYLRFDRLRVGSLGPGTLESGTSGPASLRPWYSRPSYYLALVLFLFALWSKTVTCTLPAAMLLVLWWKKPRLGRAEIVPLLPFFAMGLVLAFVTVWMEKTHVGAQGEAWSLGLGGRCLLAGRIPWFYAWKLLAPMDLAFIYHRWSVDPGAAWQYLFPAGLAGGGLALWLMRRRLGKGPLVAVLIFVGSLVPALGFFNVYPMRFSYVADHFQYLATPALIALMVGVGWALLQRLGKRRARIGAVLMSGVLLVVLGGFTWKQSLVYLDQETLWADTLEKNPGAWIAHSNWAEILFDKGDVDRAMAHCEAALDLKPDLPEAHGNMANALYGKGRYEEAVTHFHEVLRLDPDNPIARSNLAATLEKMGRLDEAVAYCKEAIEIDGTSWKTHFILANILVQQGKYSDATKGYSRVLALYPGYDEAHYRLGVVLQALGRNKEAVKHLRAALDQARFKGQAGKVRELENRLSDLE